MCAVGTRRRETRSSMGQVGKDSRRRILEPKSEGQVEVLKQRIRVKCSRQREWHVARNETMPNLGNCKLLGLAKHRLPVGVVGCDCLYGKYPPLFHFLPWPHSCQSYANSKSQTSPRSTYEKDTRWSLVHIVLSFDQIALLSKAR